MGFSFNLVALLTKEQALSNSKLRTMKLVSLGKLCIIADIKKRKAEISFARHDYISHDPPLHNIYYINIVSPKETNFIVLNLELGRACSLVNMAIGRFGRILLIWKLTYEPS